jgi:HEAT repeat protein
MDEMPLMAGQPWLLSCSGLLSFGLFLGSVPFPLSQLSRFGFSQTQPTVSAAANKIAQNCTAEEVEQYIAAFRDPWQRENAMRQLVTNCGPTAIPALTKVLKTDPDAGVRQTAATTLAYIGGPDGTKVLLTTLKTDSDPIVRKTAADALGYLRATSAIAPLIATLEQPQESLQVRQAAAEALGAIQSISAIDPLMATLRNANEALDLRHEAAKALAKIGDAAIESLLLSLQSNDLHTRYWSVLSLSEINSPRSNKELEVNQIRVNQILEATDQAGIVEYDRVPVASAEQGSLTQFKRQPIICKINKWIAQNWARCR